MRWLTFHRWRGEQAVSDTVGAAAGITALIFLITGLLGVGEVLSAHAALSQAANAGLNTISADGCWTQATSDTIAHDVASAHGLSPATTTASLIAPTPWPTTPQLPTTAITVRLSATMHPGLGFAIPLTIQVQGVVVNPGTSNVTCLTSPSLTNADASAKVSAAAIGSASPQIVSAGPAIPGQSLTISGDNFGTTPGAVILTTAAGQSWGSAQSTQMVQSAWIAPTKADPESEVTITIPSLADAGAATVQVVAANGGESPPYGIVIQSP